MAAGESGNSGVNATTGRLLSSGDGDDGQGFVKGSLGFAPYLSLTAASRTAERAFRYLFNSIPLRSCWSPALCPWASEIAISIK